MPIRADLRHYYQSPEWFAARDLCRARAGNKCQHCGIAGGVLTPRPCPECNASGRIEDAPLGDDRCQQCGGTGQRQSRAVLTVAHLNHNPADNSDANLACLCAACHLKHDRAHHASSRQRNIDARRQQLRFDTLAPPTPPPPPASDPKPDDDPTSIDPADIDDDKDLDLAPPEGNP